METRVNSSKVASIEEDMYELIFKWGLPQWAYTKGEWNEYVTFKRHLATRLKRYQLGGEYLDVDIRYLDHTGSPQEILRIV